MLPKIAAETPKPQTANSNLIQMGHNTKCFASKGWATVKIKLITP